MKILADIDPMDVPTLLEVAIEMAETYSFSMRKCFPEEEVVEKAMDMYEKYHKQFKAMKGENNGIKH